jgi:hypothetical protein
MSLRVRAILRLVDHMSAAQPADHAARLASIVKGCGAVTAIASAKSVSAASGMGSIQSAPKGPPGRRR